jgi:nucleotide-binding universal stress UspA family protein
VRDTGPILLPLDGSELGEGALPFAEALARALGQRLILLTVWEGGEAELNHNFPSMARDIEAAASKHFTAYLAGAKANVTGVPVEPLLRTGDAPEEILRVAEESGVTAIVIGTHGRSGVGRWIYGSTAGHILRNGRVPVLAVGPHALENPTKDIAFKHVLCPLDGSERCESALPVAVDIARRTGARLSLVRVVRWAVQAYPYTLPDAYIPQVDQELEAAAKAYLRTKEAQITEVERSAFVVRGAVAEGLFEFIDKENVDLVIMTTHARSGLARAALGSVADRLLQSTAPVLMIPPAE